MTRPASFRRCLAALAVCLAGACLLAVWFSQPSEAPSVRVAADVEAALPAAGSPFAEPATRPASFEQIASSVAAEVPSLFGAVPQHDQVVPSHPISEGHLRLARERQFLARLDEAVFRRSGPQLRELLGEYRGAFPEDEQGLQAGYAVLADCLEEPGETTRAQAERFYERRRGSTLRRAVRRLCLEP